MAEYAVVARELSMHYGAGEARVQVLFGVHLAVERGSFTAVIGPSGSGKSTLLNLVSLLERPTGGEVIVEGVSSATMDGTALARFRNTTMGFVFQFHYLLPEFTALENVLVPAWIRDAAASAEVQAEARQLLDRLGVWSAAHKRPAQMSGGQQQRTAIARALINRPRIVYADEPTGNLDRESGDAALTLLRDLVRERGTTLVMVTHDREIALRADRIIEMVDGRVCRMFDLHTQSVAAVRRMLDERTCAPGAHEMSQ